MRMIRKRKPWQPNETSRQLLIFRDGTTKLQQTFLRSQLVAKELAPLFRSYLCVVALKLDASLLVCGPCEGEEDLA